MNQAKYHHLIPRAYLHNWCHTNDSSYTFSVNKLEKAEPININNHFGIDHYHTIKAGMLSCSKEDLIKIFEPLNNIDVYYENRLLTSLTEKNIFYYDFDNWILKYRNEQIIGRKQKNKIKDEINKFKILEIEDLWAQKYENDWKKLYELIQRKLYNSQSNQIDKFYKGKLIRFLVSLDWRSYETNPDFINTLEYINKISGLNLDTIKIPFKKQEISIDSTELELLKRNYLLKQFRSFLNEDGVIYKQAKEYIKNGAIEFLVATDLAEFITSDNPSFRYETQGGKQHILPLSPSILVRVGKLPTNRGLNFNERYNIRSIDNNEVAEINSIIIKNAQNKIISRNPTIQYKKNDI